MILLNLRVKSYPRFQRGRKEQGLLNVDANRLSRLKFSQLSIPHSECSRWKKRRYQRFNVSPGQNQLKRSHGLPKMIETTDSGTLLWVMISKINTTLTRTVGIGIITEINTIASLTMASSEKAITISPSEGIGFNHLWRMQLWMSLLSK